MTENIKDLNYYMQLKYKIEIIEEDDGGFFIKIPDLPGCMTYCDDFNEINEMIDDAKELWFQTRLEKGLTIPEPSIEESFSGKLLLRLPKSLHKKLALQSKYEGISLNQHIIQLLSSESTSIDISNNIIDFFKTSSPVRKVYEGKYSIDEKDVRGWVIQSRDRSDAFVDTSKAVVKAISSQSRENEEEITTVSTSTASDYSRDNINREGLTH